MPRMDRKARSPSAACDRVLPSAAVRTTTAAIPALLDLRLGLKSSKIFGHCTLLTLCVGPVQFVRRFAVIAAGIGLHDARIHRETLALDEAGSHAGCNHAFEK